ncbi:V-type ATPase subunit [Methanoculleus bourgensis]|uniref:Uncharacterized protein n=1 Tax=Methanoculleus bourgensis TaxID=83986 RepID=A0A0X3BMS0_9EURY|nr:V-type ATPase subunit [Methanoculleus bourgensis]CVK33406.1 protein of unknown function [Methanoculleus bourgensis]
MRLCLHPVPVRRTKLLSREDYRRIMQMSIPGVVAHLGRQEDYRDIISTWQPVFPAPGSSKRQ